MSGKETHDILTRYRDKAREALRSAEIYLRDDNLNLFEEYVRLSEQYRVLSAKYERMTRQRYSMGGVA
jgi:hypothetical protein